MKASRFVMIAPLPVILVLVIVGIPAIWQPHRVVGLALLVPSLFLLTLARWQLGDAFSIEPEATSLVTHGLYARIRNPVYVFGLLMIAGLILFLSRPWLLLLLLPIAGMQIARARREAAVLEDRFGTEYLEYRARTWF